MRPICYTLPLTSGVSIFPAGCLHWPIGEKELLKKWVNTVKSTPNGLAILMGDSTDIARTHYRDHVRTYRADKNSQEALDVMVKEDIKALAKVLSPLQGRLLGAILGNHFWEFKDGTNSEQYLCHLLAIPYLGPVGIIRLDFQDRERRKTEKVTIWAHHHGGSKGGRTQGADVNALERAEQSFDADIYCLSHTHRRHGFKVPKLGITQIGEPKLVENTKVLVRTGAFLKGFSQDKPSTTVPHFPSYAEEGALRPVDLGWVEVGISFRSGKREYKIAF